MMNAATFFRIIARCRLTAGGCWQWQGAIDHNGYARVSYHGRNWHGAKLMVTQFALRIVPDGTDCHHRCDNPRCINPDHIETAAGDVHRSRHSRAMWRVRREEKARAAFLRSVYRG